MGEGVVQRAVRADANQVPIVAVGEAVSRVDMERCEIERGEVEKYGESGTAATMPEKLT